MDSRSRARPRSSKPAKTLARWILLAALLGQVMVASAADSTGDGTRIIGDRDVPPGLHIMPWRAPDSAEIPTPTYSVGPPQAVDVDLIRRRVRYQGHSAEPANK